MSDPKELRYGGVPLVVDTNVPVGSPVFVSVDEDPRPPGCRRLGCRVREDGTIEHVALDGASGAS